MWIKGVRGRHRPGPAAIGTFFGGGSGRDFKEGPGRESPQSLFGEERLGDVGERFLQRVRILDDADRLAERRDRLNPLIYQRRVRRIKDRLIDFYLPG